MKMSELWAMFKQDMIIENYSPKTIEGYTIQFRLLVRGIGDQQLDGVKLMDIKEYIALESQRLKPASLQHRVKFIRTLFRYAHDEGLTPYNLAAKIKRPKDGKRVPKYLQEETIEKLRIEARDPLEGMLVEFLYSTGCRIGEVYNLDKKDFDLEGRSVVVRGKGDKERQVYFTKRAQILIKRYFESRADREGCFISTVNRPYKRMSIAQTRCRLKNLAKKAGVDENVYPHKLRHSFGTHLVNRGAPIEIVQQFMGHSRSDTTMIYAIHSTELKKKAYEQFF